MPPPIPPFHPHHHHQALLPHNSTTPEKSSLLYPPYSLKISIRTVNTPNRTVHTPYMSIETRCVHTAKHTQPFLHIHKHPGIGREEVNITLLSRMQKKFMLPLERESGILCELRWGIILFSAQTKKKKKGPFLGTWLPPIFSPSSHRSAATFALNGQT